MCLCCAHSPFPNFILFLFNIPILPVSSIRFPSWSFLIELLGAIITCPPVLLKRIFFLGSECMMLIFLLLLNGKRMTFFPLIINAKREENSEYLIMLLRSLLQNIL